MSVVDWHVMLTMAGEWAWAVYIMCMTHAFMLHSNIQVWKITATCTALSLKNPTFLLPMREPKGHDKLK